MKKLFFLLLIASNIGCSSQNSAGFPITNSNWIATDALGRSLPNYKQTRPVKKVK